MEKLVHLMNLNDMIRFLGERNDIIRLLEIMDVFVFPSGGEAFSITLLEAMAKKKPIVAFDVEGVNEAVVTRQTGFLVPFGDVNQFAQKIKLLLESQDLAHKMGMCGFERVNTMFNIKSNIQKIEACYESILENT